MECEDRNYILLALFKMQEANVFPVSLSPLHEAADKALKKVHTEIGVAIRNCLCIL
jgi:hypothetical protein